MKTTVYTSQILVTLMFLTSTLNAEQSLVQQETPPILQQLPRQTSTKNEQQANSHDIAATRSPNIETTVQLRPPSSKQLPSKIDSTWIESILIQVENLNLNNERLAHNKQQQQQQPLKVLHSPGESLEVDSRDQQQVNSSQAPTDSAEDPLEATTLMSTELIANQTQSNATHYSLSTESGQQLIVESNNVSAGTMEQQQLVEQEQVSNRIILDDSRQDLSVASSQEPPSNVSKQTVSCEQAYTQCAKRLACAPALKAYDEDCQDLINNRTNTCSPRCLRAMIALRSSDEGEELVTCDCQANEYCLQSKQRSMVCKAQVEEAVNPKTVVSCSTASWICMADQLCSTALGFYNRNCQSLFSQNYCSQRCNNSLSILYRQPKASKLISCHCDGSEEFACARYKTYTERLCLNIASSSGENQMDADDDQHATEEEGYNLTSDSETFILGPPQVSSASSSFSSTNNYSDDQEEYEDAKVAANDQESTSNGIHSVENNWIPIVSGRYFTNSHQQRQQQKVQHPSRQQNLTGPQQQHRKSQKSFKQKTRPNSSVYYEQHRPRRSRLRIFRFASSSASSSVVSDISKFSTYAFVVFQQLLVVSLLFSLRR